VAGKFKPPTALNGCVSLHAYNTAQTNASMDSEIFIYWFHYTSVPAMTDELKRKENLQIQRLFSFYSSRYRSELLSENIFTALLPANFTSLIQPMDQGIRKKINTLIQMELISIVVTMTKSIKNFQTKIA
jgi:hypothetical protein